MTEFEILQFINDAKDEQGNNVFVPSRDTGPVHTKDGTTIDYVRSFYRRVKTKEGDVIESIKIRSANHPVVMRSWENNGETPWKNKYNIDIVFSNNVQENADKRCHKFFVIEQFVYNIEDMTPKKLQKIIDAVLKVGEIDFSDPLEKAHKYVLQPYYINEPEKKILPPTDGSAHPHQIEVWTHYEKSQNKTKKNESFCNPKHVLRFDEFALLEKYEEYGRGIEFTDNNGINWKSIVSLKDDAGGITHIVKDDGCYLLYHGSERRGNYHRSSYIFPEAHAALKELPDPSVR